MLEHVIILLESGEYCWDQILEEGKSPTLSAQCGIINPNIVLKQPIHSSKSETITQYLLPKSKITIKWICPIDNMAPDRILVIYTKCNITLEELNLFSTFSMKKVVSLFNKYENLKHIEILKILIRKFIKGISHKVKASY